MYSGCLVNEKGKHVGPIMNSLKVYQVEMNQTNPHGICDTILYQGIDAVAIEIGRWSAGVTPNICAIPASKLVLWLGIKVNMYLFLALNYIV